MKRETGESSEKKKTSSDRDEFRRQQDIERERFRKELQERGSSKKFKAIKWIAFSLVAYIIISGIIVWVFRYAESLLPSSF